MVIHASNFSTQEMEAYESIDKDHPQFYSEISKQSELYTTQCQNIYTKIIIGSQLLQQYDSGLLNVIGT